MTRTTKTFVISCAVIFLFFLSCNKSEIAENVMLTMDFVVENDSQQFECTIIMNAFDESQVLRNYGDNITGIKIQDINYYMTYFSGPAGQQFNSAKFEVSASEGTGSFVIGSLANENLQELLYGIKKLELQNQGVKKLEELIKKDPHEFRLRISGVSNFNHNYYTLRIEIELLMIAKPL